KLVEAGTALGTIPVEPSKEGKAQIYCAEDIYSILTEEELADVKFMLTSEPVMEAPVIKGEKAGVLRAYLGNELLGESDVLIKNNVERHDFLSSLKKIIKYWTGTDFKVII
ncbi:MAG: hypothetical protein IJC39_05620, partial [Firmicutes bacterium]|nr:hypothetical protein [Bacillota bacterium]